MKLFLSLLALTVLLFAAPLNVGETYKSITVVDPHEKSFTVDNVDYIIFSGDKASGKIGHEAVSKKTQAFLDEKKIVYLSDMSGVPSLIYSLFMEGKFKEYKYRLGLIWEEEDVMQFPKKEDQVTVLSLKNDQVTNIQYFKSAKELETFLDSL